MATYSVCFFNAGTPAAGLTPTIVTHLKISDGASAGAAPVVAEVGGGFYRFTATPTVDVAVVIDGGVALPATDRYVPLQITPDDNLLREIYGMGGANTRIKNGIFNTAGQLTSGQRVVYANAADATADAAPVATYQITATYDAVGNILTYLSAKV